MHNRQGLTNDLSHDDRGMFLRERFDLDAAAMETRVSRLLLSTRRRVSKYNDGVTSVQMSIEQICSLKDDEDRDLPNSVIYYASML